MKRSPPRVVSTALTIGDRSSDSPYVDLIWRSPCECGGRFVSMAQSHFEIAVTRLTGRTFVTLRGPESTTTSAACARLVHGVSVTGHQID